MCGLAGILRKEKGLFDFSTFCTLGIANDSRGGDSCGIFIDGEVEYGTGVYNKYFQNFMFDSKLLQKTNSSKIALLHCRKASVGTISEKTAQPVVLKDKAGNVLYVLMHNGTIYNYKELAKKYIPGVNIDGMTDSQVMARIFYYKGYDALDEYQGGAVFAIIDYRQPEPTLYLWRGESKKTSTAKEKEGERPLYISVDKGEIVFSSIASYLYAQRPFAGVFEAPGNKLLKWTGKKLIAIHNYSRDSVGQYKVYSSTVASSSPYFYLHGGGTTGGYTTSSYIKYETTSNSYSIGGKDVDGFHYVTRLGRLEDKRIADSVPVYFFCGIPIRKISYHSFLERCLKKSKLTAKEFLEKNKNFVKFLSCDRIYLKDGVTLEAVGPFESRPFTGRFQPIGETWGSEFKDGRFSSRYSAGNYEAPLKQLEQDIEINITLDKKLMKQICCS